MNEEKKENTWEQREIGAMWKRDGVNQKYLVGRLKLEKVPKDSEELNIVVFSNKNKSKETHPDFRVYVSQSKEEREAERAEEPAAPSGAEVSENELV
jgi:uncharacterized protein (DUF736 family)